MQIESATCRTVRTAVVRFEGSDGPKPRSIGQTSRTRTGPVGMVSIAPMTPRSTSEMPWRISRASYKPEEGSV